ncbi:hypothetical protein HDU67_000569 [Dinochytrium kinnereticum]|nr:hypothetical protein HDU67_000569 [Dinochytrium kinnereticum]
MQIFVPLVETDPNTPAVTTDMEKHVLIELQGTLESGGEGGLAGKELGKLTKEGEKYFLTIGRHKLTGTRIDLKKPLAVIKKIPRIVTTTSPPSVSTATSPVKSVESRIGGMVGDINMTETTLEEREKRMEIVTVVWCKYVFKTRPSVVLREENRGLAGFKRERGGG